MISRRQAFIFMRIVKYCARVPTCLVETYMTLDTDSLSFRHIKQLSTISTTPMSISNYGFPEKISWLEPKRIEYKEATLRFGRRRLFIFEVFLGLHRKSEGEEGDTGLCLWQPSYLSES